MAYATQLKDRTLDFSLQIIKLCKELPHTVEAQVIAKQLLRCGTSVGANYRAACRGRSKPDFISKLGIVLEEADETVYWLELIIKSGMLPQARVADPLREANELVAIFVASSRTAKGADSAV